MKVASLPSIRRSNFWTRPIRGFASSSIEPPIGRLMEEGLWLLTCESSSMSTEAKVGAFVIVSILVLGLSVYWVTHTQNVKGQVVFKTYFHFAGGLAPGASVLFGGIKVGQIEEVRPSAEDPTRIEVAFNV